MKASPKTFDSAPFFAASWERACHALGLPGGNEALRDRVLARYAEPHRKYHTLQHLHECLARLAPVLPQAEHPGEVEFGLWFHDAVYELGSHDNEAESAQWAVAELAAAGVNAEVMARVDALIMATLHSALPRTQDEQLLVDVDLAILGALPARFDEYEAQVRDEYSFVPHDVFQLKRAEILAGFLARPVIYNLPSMREALELQARENLARSIALLKGLHSGARVNPAIRKRRSPVHRGN